MYYLILGTCLLSTADSCSLEPFPWAYPWEEVCTTGPPGAPQFNVECQILPWQRTRVATPHVVGTAVVPMVAPRLPSRVDETGQLLRKVWSNFLSEVSVVSLALKETFSVLVQWVYPFSSTLMTQTQYCCLLGWWFWGSRVLPGIGSRFLLLDSLYIKSTWYLK